MTLPIVDPSLFTDAQSLATLKSQAAAHNPKALRAAAQQFESLFIGMVLKSAQDANFKDPLFGSSQQRMYQDLYDQQLSMQLSKTHTFGLAEMLVQQLRRQWSGSGSSTAAGSGTPSASRTAAPPGAVSSLAAPAASPGAPRASGAADGTSIPPVSAAQQSAFARSLWPDAQRAARQLGVSPVSLIAQAALETDWGRSLPRTASGTTSNNLFGIKAEHGWSGSSVASATHEYRNGIDTATQAQFRAYGSCSQCFQDYTSLLSHNPRYAAALGTGNDVGAFATALQQAGYATDPNYARKLTEVAATLTRTLSAPADPGVLKLAAVSPMTTGSRSI
jgi:flagellar protein FlgJ